MQSSVANFPATAPTNTTTATRADSLPWFVYAVVLAAACIPIGALWDISWHSTIGRDSFWNPAHIMIYLGGAVPGMVCGWLALKTSFFGTAVTAAMKAGYAWLAFIAVLASAVSLFYYFRIASAMFFAEGSGAKLKGSYALSAVVLICAAGTLVIGVAPQPFVEVLKYCVLPR